MAYIGREPQIGNYQVCDAISVVNGQAAYTMQVGSVNVSPESANHMIVSLNGVIQKPGSSFTISGSTITFSSNLATGDAIDFIYLLGNVLDVGVPSDATVTTAKIVDDAVTLGKMASGTDGNIISYDASGNPVAVATGSSGQVLTSAGAGAVPSFSAAPSGGVTLLSATTLGSNATTIDIDNVFSTTYNCYKVFILNLTNEGTEFPGIRYLVGGTAQTGNYMILGDGNYRTSTSAGSGTEWDAGYLENYMSLGNWNYDDNGNASNHEMTFFEPNGGAYPNQILGSSMTKQAAYPVTWNWSSWYASDINATGFRILMSGGGNIIAGCKVNVYGFKLS